MRKIEKWQKFNGFTIPELLVVMIIMGFLAVIFVSIWEQDQRGQLFEKCRGEGRQYSGMLLRSQQSFFQQNKRFAVSIDELKAPKLDPKCFYNYSITNEANKTFVYSITKREALKSYVGGVFIDTTKAEPENSKAILCKAKMAGAQPIEPPIDAQTCGKGTVLPGRDR